MFVRYKGGRSRLKVSFGRKPYYFTPENNRMIDIKEQSVINYIFSQPNRAEFEVVEKTPEVLEVPIQPEESKEEVKKEVKTKSIKKKSKRKKGAKNG